MAFWNIQHILNKIFDSATSALNIKVTGSTTSGASAGAAPTEVQQVGGMYSAPASRTLDKLYSLLLDLKGNLLVRLAASAGGGLTDRGPTADTITASAIDGPDVVAHLYASNGTTQDRLRAYNPNIDAIGPNSQGALMTLAGNIGYNGATWDRLRSVNTGQLVVTPRGPVGTEVIAATGAAIPAGIIQIGGNDGSTARALKLGTPGADAKAWTATDGVNANAVGYLFNDASFDRQRNNVSATPFTSAARTATSSSGDQTNYNGQGVIVTINVSLDPSTASVVFTIEAKDPVSGAYTTVLTSAAIAAVGTTRLRVGPNITPAANVAVADLLGRTWRVTATHADAESLTYSVSQETMTA